MKTSCWSFPSPCSTAQHIKGDKRSQGSGLCAVSRNAPLHLPSPTFVDTALFFLRLSCIPCGSNDQTHLSAFCSKLPPLRNSPSHPLEGSSTATSHYDITGTLFFLSVYACLFPTDYEFLETRQWFLFSLYHNM